MERRAPGRISFVVAVLFFAACDHDVNSLRRYDFGKENIAAHGGITRINGEPINGTVFSLDKNRDTVMLVSYRDGKEHGVAKSWYAKNQLKEVRAYVNGKKEGRHYGWHPNGAKWFEYDFNNDEYDGSFREWLPDGTLLLNLHFSKGHENGIQQTWFEDGKVKSNYIIKDGRRYGLLGTKNCVNVEDNLPRQFD